MQNMNAAFEDTYNWYPEDEMLGCNGIVRDAYAAYTPSHVTDSHLEVAKERPAMMRQTKTETEGKLGQIGSCGNGKWQGKG